MSAATTPVLPVQADSHADTQQPRHRDAVAVTVAFAFDVTVAAGDLHPCALDDTGSTGIRERERAGRLAA